MNLRAACAFAAAALASSAYADTLTVARVTGTGTVTHAGTAQPALSRVPVIAGDVVAAGNRSRIGLNLGRRGEIVLAGLSELQVFDAPKGVAKLKLLAGAMRVQGDAAPKAQTQDVRLNIGNLKTRLLPGTILWGATTQEGDVVCLLGGQLDVQVNGQELQKHLAKVGECLRQPPLGDATQLSASSDALITAAIAATQFPKELPPPIAAPERIASTPSPVAAQVASATTVAPVMPAMKAPIAPVVPAAPVLAVPPPAAPVLPKAPPLPELAAPKTAPPVKIVLPAAKVSMDIPAPKLPKARVVYTTPRDATPTAPTPAMTAETSAATSVVISPSAAPAKAMAATPAAASLAGKWTVVVLSSTDQASAQSRTVALQDQGFVANLRPAQVKGKTVYRITVGQFDSRADADAYNQRTLVAAGFKGWLSPL